MTCLLALEVTTFNNVLLINIYTHSIDEEFKNVQTDFSTKQTTSKLYLYLYCKINFKPGKQGFTFYEKLSDKLTPRSTDHNRRKGTSTWEWSSTQFLTTAWIPGRQWQRGGGRIDVCKKTTLPFVRLQITGECCVAFLSSILCWIDLLLLLLTSLPYLVPGTFLVNNKINLSVFKTFLTTL